MGIVAIQIVFTIAFLGLLSYLDIKYRDIRGEYIYSFIAISFILSVLNTLMGARPPMETLIMYILTTILCGPLVTYALYRMRLLGLGDVYVVVGLSIMFHYIDIYDYTILRTDMLFHIPPIIPILMYANIAVLIYIPFNIIRNVVRYRHIIPKESFMKRLAIISTGKPMRIRDFLRSKHRFLLEKLLVAPNGSLVRTYRVSFNIDEDYRAHQRVVKELVDKGLLKPNDYVWTTYGLPYILLILIGFIAFLVIGDYPIMIFIRGLLGL